MILSIFDHSQHIKNAFINAGRQCISLDLRQNKLKTKVDIVCDILEWDYKIYSPGHIKFLFIALPCTTWSKASGGFHFKNNIPITPQAYKSINILIKIYQITQYFKCPFLIENPTGGLINNAFFKSFFSLNVTRLSLSNFGFPTQKQTDLFYNFDMLLLVPVTYRCNKRYQKQALYNLTYRKKVTYPLSFCTWLTSNLLPYIKQ